MRKYLTPVIILAAMVLYSSVVVVNEGVVLAARLQNAVNTNGLGILDHQRQRAVEHGLFTVSQTDHDIG